METNELSWREELMPQVISIVSNSQLLLEGLGVLLAKHFVGGRIDTYSTDTCLNIPLFDVQLQVVLIDCGIGPDAVLALIRHFRQAGGHLFIVVLELHDNTDFIVTCIEAGANGYSLRGATSNDVAQTITRVCSGQPSCSPRITAEIFVRLARLSSTNGSVPRTMLTAREMDILELLVKGFSNKEIAAQLVIEIRTVKHHVHNILAKLNVEHRWDAARVATRQGWFNHLS